MSEVEDAIRTFCAPSFDKRGTRLVGAEVKLCRASKRLSTEMIAG